MERSVEQGLEVGEEQMDLGERGLDEGGIVS